MARAGTIWSAGLFAMVLQTAVAASPPESPGAWVLEVRFANYAWRHIRRDCAFTASGDSYRLELVGDAFPGPPLAEGERADTATILAHYLGQSVVGRVSSDALARFGQADILLRAARAGHIQKRQSAYDAGETEWIGWVREAEGHYRRVILRGRGDSAITNRAPAAAKLLAIIDAQPELACHPQDPPSNPTQEPKP